MEELLSLKWNNHRSTFIHVLGILRDKQLYTDATLACDGKFYSVHKLVLSTCSDYFSAMLDRTNCKNPVIVLKDIKCEDLEALLDYMYLGEVNVRQSDLATLIKAAECLRVKGLAVPDDEPPPRKTRSENQTRRGDASGSPPAKRKRRSDIDDGRDDVRPVRQDPRQSSPVHISSSRPKSPTASSTPLSPVHSRSTPQRQPSEATVPPSPRTNSQDDAHTDSAIGAQESNQNSGYQSDHAEPFVKVEMDDNGANDVEAYDLSNDGAFKEEGEDGTASAGAGGGESGGDLSSDLPEFLQQASSGPLQGGAFAHSSFSGSFQPGDMAGWQGDGSNIGFPHLNFGSTEGSSQQNAPGATIASSNTWIAMNPSTESVQQQRLPAHRYLHASSEGLLCPVCSKQFDGRNKKQNLKHHLMTHTGERRYTCPFCPHRTAHKWHLKTHVLRRHPDNTMDDVVAWLGCKKTFHPLHEMPFHKPSLSPQVADSAPVSATNQNHPQLSYNLKY